MPELFFIFGYIFYVTSFDKGEPFHVHIISRSKIKVRRGSDCSTKLWLGKFGEVSVAHNGDHILERHLKKLFRFLKEIKRSITKS